MKKITEKVKSKFLVGKRTYLRPVELSDTRLIQTWHNDPEIRRLARLGELPITYTKEEEDIKMARASSEETYLMIVETSGDRSIGFVRLNYIDTVSRNMWLRMIIGDVEARGRNLTEDALRVVLEWLFAEQNVHRITLEAYASNKRAIHFFEKLGFRKEGVIREAVYAAGEYYDIVTLGLLNREFTST